MPDLPYYSEPQHDLAGNPISQPPQPPPVYQPGPLPQEEKNLYPKEGYNFKKLGVLVVLVLLIFASVGVLIFRPDLPFLSNYGPAALTYWGVGVPEAAMQPLIDKFRISHPNVTITYVNQSPSQYQQTLLTRLRQGTGPDLFRFHSSWTPVLKAQLAPVPGSVYSNSSMASTFYPTTATDLQLDGKYYGIPLMYDGLVLIYNLNMLQAGGFSSPPETWSDVRQVYAPKLTTHNPDGSISVSGIALGTSGNVDFFSDILGLLMLQNGVRMTSGNQISFQKTLSSDGKRNLGADALDFYTLFTSHAFSGSGAAWDNTLPASAKAFATGKVAMVLLPESSVVGVLNLMKQNNAQFTLKVARVPQPQAFNQGRSVDWASYWAEGVSTTSPHQSAAWDFIKFLSQKDSEVALNASEAQIDGVGQAPSRIDLASTFSNDKYAGPLLAEASDAKSWYMTSGTFDQGVDDAIAALFATAVNTVTSTTNNQVTSASALATTAKGASQILSPYGLVAPSAAGAASQ